MRKEFSKLDNKLKLHTNSKSEQLIRNQQVHPFDPGRRLQNLRGFQLVMLNPLFLYNPSMSANQGIFRQFCRSFVEEIKLQPSHDEAAGTV